MTSRPAEVDSSPDGQPVVLVAPDSFKGTYTAQEVARAIARGLREGGVEADPCPAADGGEGTMAILVEALGGEVRWTRAQDPLGRTIDAPYGLLDGGRTGVVESAAASGLQHLPTPPIAEHAERATSRGTGELVIAARDAGARRVLVAVGGSASTDGGSGAIAAIMAAGGLDCLELAVLCDVQTPFRRAAEVFGPQKGADARCVTRLSARLDSLARRLPRNPSDVPMTGCAGGLSGGLWATFGARLVPGAAFVLDALGFDARLAAARAVVTGEGRLDAQTSAGKVVAEIGRRCGVLGRPLHAIVGQADVSPEEAHALSLESITTATCERELSGAGAALARRLAAQPRLSAPGG